MYVAEDTVAQSDLDSGGELTLRVLLGDKVIFDSWEALAEYETKHHIEAWQDSSFEVYITLNNIVFHGEVKDGMIL